METRFISKLLLRDIAVVDLDKQLVIIGNGYFLDQNVGLKANTQSSRIINGWNFNAGSEGSVITGLRIQHNAPINVNADSVFIIRNELLAGLTINANHVSILQNFSPYGYVFTPNFCSI